MKKYNTILLVDDDPISNFINSAVLQRLGIAGELLIERNGLKAINSIIDLYMKNMSTPELIFLDINMPIMDGFEFLERFEKLPEEVTTKAKIIIVSNIFRKSDIEILNKKELLYMAKPLESNMLKTILDKYDSSKQVEQAL